MTKEKGFRKEWIQSGQVTVFSGLLFVIVAALIAAQLESALFYVQRAGGERAAKLSVDSFLAGYCRPMKEYYQILAVDGGFGEARFQEEKIENLLKKNFEDNLAGLWGMDSAESSVDAPEYTWMIGGDWAFFVREISLNRSGELLENGAEWILERWKDEKGAVSSDLAKKQEEAMARSSEEGEEEEKSPLEVKPEEINDPRGFVEEIWNQGILAAACPENFTLSEKICPMTDVSFPEGGSRVRTEIDFKDDQKMGALFNDWERNLMDGSRNFSLTEDAAVQFYILDVFQHAARKSGTGHGQERVLDYEIEYILAGNEKDGENLKAVLWKILALRCVMNLTYLLASAEKSAQVGETALVLSAALLIPEFTEVVALLLKISWAFAESLADCRTLLKGGRIPIIKNDRSWYLTWEQMLQLKGSVLDGNEGGEGFDYGGYLYVLLQLMNRETKYRRMTHIMEKTIRLTEAYSDFRMENCIYGIRASFRCRNDRGEEYTSAAAMSY